MVEFRKLRSYISTFQDLRYAIIAWFVHGLLYIGESCVLFKKDVSEQWRRKFPACRLDCNKAGKEDESMPGGWRKLLFKNWSEVEG